MATDYKIVVVPDTGGTRPCLGLQLLFAYKLQKHFQNVMLVGMASEISKNYTYKCVDRSRHNGIKGAKAKCAH